VDIPASRNYCIPASTDDICCPTRDSNDVTVPPSLRCVGRIAIELAGMALSGAAVAMRAAGLVGWLTPLAPERTVMPLGHTDRHTDTDTDTDTMARPANHDHSRSAHLARGGCVPGSGNSDGPIQLRSSQPETAVALLRMLGIQHASIEQQKPLLRTWLTANLPSPGLRISLRRNGYGFVLNSIYGRPTAGNCRARAAQPRCTRTGGYAFRYSSITEMSSGTKLKCRGVERLLD
jgi:hypothetical protein